MEQCLIDNKYVQLQIKDVKIVVWKIVRGQ